MHWFLDPIQNHYVDFTGRATRQQFWMFILFNIIISVIVNVVATGIHLRFLTTLYSLVVLLPCLALGARRLHDIGKSGWWQLICLIVFFVQDSHPGNNEYGPNPKGNQGKAPEETMNPESTSTEDSVQPQEGEITN